jgi:hypothetical protein
MIYKQNEETIKNVLSLLEIRSVIAAETSL